MSINETIQALEQGFVSFKSAHDEKLQGLEQRLDSFETKGNRQGLGAGEPSTVHSKAESKALRTFIKSGGADDRELKGMAVGSDPDGGYLVLPQLSTAMTVVPFEQSPIRALARVETISSDAFEELVDKDEAGASWVSETGSRPETTAPDLAKLRIPVHEIYAAPQVTQKLLDDASINLAAWLTDKIRDKFIRTQNTAFVTGNGVGKPRGFLTYPVSTAADSSRAWGTLQYVASGAAGDFATSNPADKLVELVYTLKAEYRSNASWVMNRDTARRIRQMKDGQGNYLWQPTAASGQPDRLLGFPVALVEDMPGVAADALSVAFGDFRRGFVVVQRHGLRLLVDPYTSKPNTVFYSYGRIGSDITDFNAIKLLKIAAS